MHHRMDKGVPSALWRAWLRYNSKVYPQPHRPANLSRCFCRKLHQFSHRLHARRAELGAHKTENRVPPPLLPNQAQALLALADGTVFHGVSIGAAGHTIGEVVFNTALTGYQEILTDPSYCRQIVTLTYPHIGNYGVNDEDVEATKVHAAGLVIKDLPLLASNFRKTSDLSDYLKAEGTVAIANIDTRR